MTIRNLRILVEVCRHESITRAAEALYMTQPAVTRAVQELEQYYGVKLFERIHRRLCITEAGRAFCAQATHIIDAFDLMEKGMRDWDEFGMLRVGASITLGNTLLPKVLSMFRRTHPNLRVQSMVACGAVLEQALMDNRLDFALIEGRGENSQLIWEAFSEDRLVLLLPPGDARARAERLVLKDLAGERFLLREVGSAGRMFLDHVFAARDVSLEPVMESVSTQAIVRAVHEGLGVAFLPEKLVRADIESGFVSTRQVDDETFRRENYIVWHESKFLTQSAREMMQCFRELAGE